ncbi:MAG: DNA mismatch repair protein, partial [Coprothermobacter proteolyticus]
FGQKAQFRAFTASQGELDIYLNPNIVGELILSVNGRLIKGSAYFQVLRILKDMWGGANLPVMVLRLNVEPDQVDVNVHPQKLDIRFKSQVWLRQALQELITQVRGEGGGLGIDFKTSGEMPHYQSEAWTTTPNDAPTVVSEAMRENYMLFQKEALQNQKDVGSVVSKGFEIKDYLYDTYILIKRDGVYELWDQHAVNEKINYWRLSSLYGVQFLLEPLFCGVDEETAQALTEMGFELQQVRGGYLIKAVPSLLLLSRSLDVIIDDLESIKGNIEKTRADLACKSAVKAGQKLSPMEIEALVVEGLKVLDVSYDPHGRPAVVKLDEALIERLFNR